MFPEYLADHPVAHDRIVDLDFEPGQPQGPYIPKPIQGYFPQAQAQFVYVSGLELLADLHIHLLDDSAFEADTEHLGETGSELEGFQSGLELSSDAQPEQLELEVSVGATGSPGQELQAGVHRLTRL